MTLAISKETVRHLALLKQSLHRRPPVPNKQTLLRVIRQIGLLQLDSINVVSRSHYLVMLSRVGPYNPADLDELLCPDRRLFEQWAHAACLIPTDDYEYFAPIILARRDPSYRSPHRRLRRLGKDSLGILDSILARVRQQGPLASKDFKNSEQKRTKWFDWKPAKVALEILFEQGYLMVDHRENFQRYYDLAERVLPVSLQPPAHMVTTYHRWATLRSLASLGVATSPHISNYYRQNKSLTQAVIKTLVDEEAIIPVKVHGWKDEAFLCSSDLPLIRKIEGGNFQPVVTAFLSPFDNLIWDRTRVRNVFDFDYKAEMYTPLTACKRTFGYYSMPLLHKGRLVGRLDPKIDRKTSTLIIHSISLEKTQPVTEELIIGVTTALREFMTFHSCKQLVIEHSDHTGLKKMIFGLMNGIGAKESG